MEIHYIKNKNIDKEKWDRCIENSFNGVLYAMSWYLDVASDYWDVLVYGDYEIVFPITYTKKLGLKILRQPVSSQQLGFFSKEALSQEVMIEFLEAIPKSFLFGSLHLNAGNKIITTKKFPVEYKVNIELDVRTPIEEVREQYENHNKRNLKKALKNNIIIKEGEDYIRIINTFRNNRGTSKYHVHKNTFKRIYQIFEVLHKKNILKVYDTYNSGSEFVAGNIVSVYKNRHIASFSGSTEEGYKTLARYFLLDYAISLACKEAEIFDFEGTNTKSLAFVYHGFGGKTVPYPVVKVSNVPKIFVKGVSMFKRLLQRKR